MSSEMCTKKEKKPREKEKKRKQWKENVGLIYVSSVKKALRGV